MYTLQYIKDTYYAALALGMSSEGFDEHFKNNYIKVYNIKFEFLGYERS